MQQVQKSKNMSPEANCMNLGKQHCSIIIQTDNSILDSIHKSLVTLNLTRF